jgi:cell division septum initiation protein DivIVA
MVKGGSTDMSKKLTDEIVRAAIDGFTAQKAHLNQRIAELREMLNGGPAQPATAAEPAPRKSRKFSAATLRRMRAAQRLRWAKIRGESKPAAPARTKAAKPKRKISPEGLKRISAASKKRWRLQWAAKAKSVGATKRKAA